MKSKILFFTLLLISLNAIASNAVRFGIIGGENKSTFKRGYSGGNLSGFYIRSTSEIPLFTNNIYSNSSTLISIKSDKNLESNALYIDIPLFLKYKCSLSKKKSVFISGCPILSYVIGGTYPTDESSAYYNIISLYDNTDVLFKDLYYLLNRFDLAIGINAGIELSKHYQFSTRYDFSIIDISHNSYYTIHGKNFKLSLAYFFSKRYI